MVESRRLQAIVDNAQGRAPLLLVCEHASRFIPDEFSGLGLSEHQLREHIAWDIGAFALARRMAQALDAPLVAAPASRLLVDPNRDIGAHDLIPATAAGEPVPGNQNLTEDQRRARVDAFHVPFHDAIEVCLASRPDISAMVAVHSFTPVLLGSTRPWHAGILHGADTRMADAMIASLARDQSLTIGRNQPYAPEQGVFYTMTRHAGARATAMIEVRNDLLSDEAGEIGWAERLALAVSAAMSALAENALSATK